MQNIRLSIEFMALTMYVSEANNNDSNNEH